MDYLVKDSTDSKQYVNPERYDIPYGQKDFYYVGNKFMDISLNKTDCDELNTDASLQDPKYCKNVLSDPVLSDPSANPIGLNKCFKKAMCDNKSAAIDLIKNTDKKNSSLQNENDYTSFYNVEVLQSFNLGVGILGLISGIIYIFLNKNQ